MIIDGKKIADRILGEVALEVAQLPSSPKLAAITCAPNFETKKYLELKKLKASSVGIDLSVVELPQEATTTDVIDCIVRVSQEVDGIVVQLPMPIHINKAAVIQAIPADADPDGFLYGDKHDRLLPPVVGAIDEISHEYALDWKNKKVVVLGQGTLVGKPAARYARKQGARVRVYEKNNLDIISLKTADIIVSGIGQPNFITSDLVSEGVIVFDAGTSEDGGVLVGDADKKVSEKASLLTPVPRGIGPITIAYLLKNLVQLVRQ